MFASFLLLQSCATADPWWVQEGERVYQQHVAEENAELARFENYKAQILAAANRGEITQIEATDLIYKAEVDYSERRKQERFREQEQVREQERMINERQYQEKSLALQNQADDTSSYYKQDTVTISPSKDPLRLTCTPDGFGNTNCREDY